MVVSLIQSDLVGFVHDPGLSAIDACDRQLSCEGAARYTRVPVRAITLAFLDLGLDH